MKWGTISMWAVAGCAMAGPATLREQVERLVPEQVAAAVRAQTGAPQGDAPDWAGTLAARRAALLERFDEAAARAWLGEVRQRLLAPEAFGVAHVAVVRRTHGNLAQPANWAAVRELNLKGLTNEIAVLTGLRGEPSVRPLYQPPPETFAGEMGLHWDARRLIFTERAPGRPSRVKELTLADGRAVELPLIPDPDVDNYAGCYLPDDSLIFLSTATFIGVPCVRGSSWIAHLYRWWPASGTIRRLTFDQEHNWHPTVLDDGRVLYLRWEYSDIPHYAARLLFTMNPDGTGQRAFYGSNSYWPNGVFFPCQMPGDPLRVAGIVSGHHGVPRMGELVVFDPGRGRFEADGAVARAGSPNRAVKPVILDNLVDASWPKFLDPTPMTRDAFLVAAQPGPNALWGLYYADLHGNLLLLHEDPQWAVLEPVPLVPRARPPQFPDSVAASKKTGLAKIVDVYSGPGLRGVPRGTVKRLRVFSYAFSYRGMGAQWDSVGFDGPWDVRRILGTVPVESDGSAFFEIPANTPIALQPLDADGRALQTMRSWFTAMPGEMQSCAGCHEAQNSSIGEESQRLALLKPPAKIQPWLGPARGFSFNREVQPVLDASCVRCHDGTAGRPDLRCLPDVRAGRPAKGYDDPAHFPPAYLALKRFVRGYTMEGDLHLLNPYECHASTTELVRLLERGHQKVALSAEAWARITTWIDLNTPAHGTWTEICGTNRVAKMAARQRELNRRYGGVDVDLEDEAVRDQRSEVRDQRSEVRDQRSEVRDQRSEIGDQRSEGGGQTVEGWPFDAAEARRRQAAAGETRRTVDLGGGVTLALVKIPAGKFIAADGGVMEVPRPFWIGRTEVSNRQFARFDPRHDSRIETDDFMQFGAEERGDPVNGPEQPVCRVSWQQAKAFCEWLAGACGEDCALPSGAQWEWAARAGASGELAYGTAETDFAKVANLADATFRQVKRFPPWDLPHGAIPPWRPAAAAVIDGFRVSAPVGSFAPNAWGVCDAHGNVAEWTRDAASDGTRRLTRGGSWWSRPRRAVFREAWPYASWQGVFDVGFRVVIDAR
ncbi:MAG: SUMF1/EgtB/PvdO family nonheme iron enzyme [Kiritimatiellae bacterium]|nr:SUMF1/EgtB/PvdO family nonheme iron enzyme [Kiritimatiellia bacterium]